MKCSFLILEEGIVIQHDVVLTSKYPENDVFSQLNDRDKEYIEVSTEDGTIIIKKSIIQRVLFKSW